jgi:acyl-CoA reductase-like NAD-dependent aldehyde dehydrogenase
MAVPVGGYVTTMARKQKSNELDAEDRNAMPDGEFAFPRLRKEPLNDASHVRNAIARFDQVRDVSDAERDQAFRRIQRAARRFGVEMTECRWQELGKPSATRKSPDKPRTTTTKAELYAEAKKRHIPGRSSMTKAELQRAVGTR